MTFIFSDASDHRKPQGLHGLRAVKRLTLGSGPNPCFLFSGFSIVPRLDFLLFLSVLLFAFCSFLNGKYPVPDQRRD